MRLSEYSLRGLGRGEADGKTTDTGAGRGGDAQGSATGTKAAGAKAQVFVPPPVKTKRGAVLPTRTPVKVPPKTQAPPAGSKAPASKEPSGSKAPAGDKAPPKSASEVAGEVQALNCPAGTKPNKSGTGCIADRSADVPKEPTAVPNSTTTMTEQPATQTVTPKTEVMTPNDPSAGGASPPPYSTPGSAYGAGSATGPADVTDMKPPGDASLTTVSEEPVISVTPTLPPDAMKTAGSEAKSPTPSTSPSNVKYVVGALGLFGLGYVIHRFKKGTS